jgi:hypothetical protein
MKKSVDHFVTSSYPPSILSIEEFKAKLDASVYELQKILGPSMIS